MPCKNYSRNPGILTDLQKINSSKYSSILTHAGKITDLFATLFLQKLVGAAKLKARSEASR
jgi:hypothetical protein